MKLWLVKRKDPIGYDQYDSMVVAAETEEEARLTHPSGYLKAEKVGAYYKWFWDMPLSNLNGKPYTNDTWGNVKDLSVEYLGTTDRDIKGVVLASFNAG